MSFLYPSFLWALFALSVAIIIHLFNFKRYKTVYFSNNRFLKAVQSKSQSFNKIRHWIILLIRLLAISFLVFTFAQPFIPAKEANGQKLNHVSIYLDNSLSMDSKGLEGSLIDQARSEAIEIINSLPKSFEFQILTNDFLTKQQKFYSPQEAKRLIDEITITNAFRQIKEIDAKIESAWQDVDTDTSNQLLVFILSDFQKSSFSNLSLLDKENRQIKTLVFREANPSNNIAIDSVWFEQPILQPGFDQLLFVNIKNYGNKEIDQQSLALKINGQLIGAQEFLIEPKEKKTFSFTIRPNEQQDYKGVLSLEAGQPFFDNHFHFTYAVNDPVRILVIGDGEKDIFQRLFQDSIYQLNFVQPTGIDFGDLTNYGLIVLNKLNSFPVGLSRILKNNLIEGKNVILFPSTEKVNATNDFLSQLSLKGFEANPESNLKVTNVSWKDQIFENVFSENPKNSQLPNMRVILKSRDQGFSLLKLENGHSLLDRIPIENGQFLLFHSNLSETAGDLGKHAVIVPIMLNSALFSYAKKSLYLTAGSISSQQFFRSKSEDDKPLSILYKEKEIIPRQVNKGNKTEIFGLPPEINPGIYPVVENKTEVGQIAVNIDARESDWSFWNLSEIKEKLGTGNVQVLNAEDRNTGTYLTTAYNGYPLWRWFLAGALLFLILEIALLKLWK